MDQDDNAGEAESHAVEIGDGRGLDGLRRHVALTRKELWVFYLGLGGERSVDQLTAYLAGGGGFSRHEHNVLAHALDEWFMNDDQRPDGTGTGT